MIVTVTECHNLKYIHKFKTTINTIIQNNFAHKKGEHKKKMIPPAVDELVAKIKANDPTLKEFKWEKKWSDDTKWTFGGQEDMRDLESLADALRGNSNLEVLSLEGNYVGDGGIKMMKDFLSESVTLRHLNLNHNKIGEDAIATLAECFRTGSPKLESLKLQESMIEIEGVKHIATIISESTHLKHIELADCFINDEGMKLLSDALSGNSTLQYLGLNGNSIGDGGMKFFTDVLRSNSTLQSVMMRGNEFGNEGVKMLGDALDGNTTMKHLTLGSNSKIGDEGVSFLADSLLTNSTLECLELDSNEIADEGLKSMAGIIGNKNSVLKKIMLGNNKFTEEGKKVLVDAAENSRFSTVFDFKK